MWQPIESPFDCQITSPKKETKYHGMKSYIAYQITPSVRILFFYFSFGFYLASSLLWSYSRIDQVHQNRALQKLGGKLYIPVSHPTLSEC